MKARIRVQLPALLLLAATSGCLSGRQVDAVRQFSAATAAVGEVSSSEFVRLRNETIAMNVARIQLVKPAPGEPDHNDLDESFDVEDVQARVRAAQVLATYGELLLSLATETQRDELKKASDRFSASVAALAPEDRKLDDAQREALGTVVNTIGRWVVEYKKSRAVKRIVTETGPQVLHLCELLRNDFDPEKARLATGFGVTADRLLLDSDEVLDTATGLTTRTSALAAHRMAAANRARLQAVVKRASSAIGKLEAAQKQLEAAMETGKPAVGDIKAFIEEARTLFDAIRVLG